MIYEKGIKRFKWLWSIVVRKFGFYFWKEISGEVAWDACVIKHSGHVKTEAELLKLCEESFWKRIPDDQPQWIWRVVENFESGKSALILNQYHGMCDGITMMTFVAHLSEKYTDNTLPPMRKIPILFKLIVICLYPFWFLFGFISYSSVKQDKNITQTELSYRNTDPEGNKSLHVSKFWKFSDLRVYKKFDQTFNDYMLTIISKTLYDMFKQKGSSDCQSVVLMIPYNIKPLPWKIDEI